MSEQSFMSLPVQVLETLQESELVLITGGLGLESTINNASGRCNGVNNGNGRCDSINNGDGRCDSPINNGNGSCQILL